MDNAKFIADVDAFTMKAKDLMLRVAKQSADDLVRQAQEPVAQGGDMPVDTGFLRNSLVTTLNGAEVGMGASSYILGIAGLKIGDVLSVAWSAEYAIPRHYMVGTEKGGGMWRDNAANRWQSIVAKNAKAVGNV